MSSNSGTIINRANETAPFLNALKSRNSKSLPELYSAEINTEPMAQSRVEVESSSSAGYNRTMRISLPRYGILNRLYLHSTFGGSSFTETAYAAGPPVVAANAVEYVPFIGALAFKEVRLMYNGSVLSKLNPLTMLAEMWKNSSRREKRLLVEMLGAHDHSAASAKSSTTGDRTAVAQYQRNIVDDSVNDGVNDFYLPLDFFFSAKLSPNRGLDLSVLANEVILEVDVESDSNCWTTSGTVATVPQLQNLSAVCYLTEFDIETEKQYRSLQYQAGGSPLTQLAFDTTHVIVASNISHSTANTIVDVKLNQFVGQVYKLHVFATLADNLDGNGHRFRPGQINEIQLKATGSNIVNQDELQSKEDILENYHGGGDYYSKQEGSGDFPASINCNPNHIYEVSFKHPYDFSKVSESGSVAFGQLSVPSLRVNVAGSSQQASFGAQNNLLGGNFDIHVVAYMTTLISYSTNTSGSTSIRQIMN